MKKKLLLLCTFLISFIIYADYIDAIEDVEKIDCIYKEDNKYLMLIQNEDGTHEVFSNKQSSLPEDGNWEKEKNGFDYHITLDYNVENGKCGSGNICKYDAFLALKENKIIKDGRRYLSKENYNTITKCPNIGKQKKQQFNFYDEVKREETYPLYNENNNLEKSYYGEEAINTKKEIEKSAIKEKEIIQEDESTEESIDENYNLKCKYESITLYIYDNDYIITKNGGYSAQTYTAEFTYNDLLNVTSSGKRCPKKLYYNNNKTKVYTINQNKESEKLIECTTSDGNNCEIKSEKTGTSDNTSGEEIKNCQDLFGEGLIEEINKAMNIIRLVVPILLLVFGIIDFFKATFASSEDDMKKTRERFIKRIVAAVIVFIVPYFVNLVLITANKVWEKDINPETCININKNN